MSRARELGRSVGSTLVSQALGIVISLAFIAYFGRMLPKAEMAMYAFLFTLQSWVNLFSGLGLATLAVRDTPALIAGGQREEAGRLLSSTLWYRTGLGVVVSAGLVLLAPWLSGRLFGSGDFAFQFSLVAVGGLALSVQNTASLMQWALQRFHWRALCDTVANLATRLLAIVGYFLWGFDGFLAGTIGGALVTVSVQLWTMRDMLTLRLLPIGPLMRRSGTYMGSDALRNLMMNLDQPLVGFLLGDAALADFFVAKRCHGFFAAALLAVTGPVGAKISEVRLQGAAALTEYFQKALYLVAILFIPAGLALVGLSESLLRVLVGSKYVSAAAILSLYGVVLMINSTYEIWYEAVVRLLAGHHAMLQNAVMSLVLYAAYFAFLPLAGPAGIPISAALAWLAATLLAAHSLRRRTGLTCRMDMYLRPLICGLMVLAAVLPSCWLPQTLSVFMITIIAAAMAYAAGFWLLAPPEVVSLLQRVRMRMAPPSPDTGGSGMQP